MHNPKSLAVLVVVVALGALLLAPPASASHGRLLRLSLKPLLGDSQHRRQSSDDGGAFPKCVRAWGSLCVGGGGVQGTGIVPDKGGVSGTQEADRTRPRLFAR